MPYKIMVVDDEPANLRLLERLFRRDYHVITASSGAEALQLLEQHDVALLITDQRMPGMTGIELLKSATTLRQHMVRIILTGYTDVSALVEAINCGQVYKYVTKPWNNDDLRLTVTRSLEHYETNKARFDLELANKRLAVCLKEMSEGFVRTIADALEAKDEYVRGHARRVSGYAVSIGRRMRVDVTTLEQISLSALLHDIGKIATPDQILLKPASLTDEERRIMQLHPERGARMLAGVPDMQEVADAVRYHHEHFDGGGYPEGLIGEQIPLAARIIHVADAYDAMTNPRPFREARDHQSALEQLRRRAGTQFDPQVVAAFCEIEAISLIRHSIASGFSMACLSEIPDVLEISQFNIEQLVNIVKVEPVLATSVLREANGQAINELHADLHSACTQLGEQGLRDIILRNVLHHSVDPNFTGVREHSLRTAMAARLLAEHTAIMPPETAYTLGLVHDVGELLLLTLFPEEMENILWLGGEARSDREVAAFGVDHAQIGQWVLEACGIPRVLTTAVQTHHDGMRTNSPVALLLHLANAIGHADNLYKITVLDALGSDRLAMLRLNRADLASIHDRTAIAIEQTLITS